MWNPLRERKMDAGEGAGEGGGGEIRVTMARLEGRLSYSKLVYLFLSKADEKPKQTHVL